MPHAPRYDEPFYWWGPGWAPRASLGFADLIRNGTIAPASGALLWAALARRRSLAVIGGPSGLGKSTLLWALRDLLPPGSRRLYPRGCFETFAFLDDPAIEPRNSVLLLNEISPHLPVYTWGPAVARVLEAAEQGFALLGAAHAESVTGFVALLSGSPLRIPPRRVAAFEFIALLEPTPAVESGRRVTNVWRLRPARDGVMVETLYQDWEEGSALDGGFVAGLTAFDAFPAGELERRRALLADLQLGVLADLPVDLPGPGDKNGADRATPGRLSP